MQKNLQKKLEEYMLKLEKYNYSKKSNEVKEAKTKLDIEVIKTYLKAFLQGFTGELNFLFLLKKELENAEILLKQGVYLTNIDVIDVMDVECLIFLASSSFFVTLALDNYIDIRNVGKQLERVRKINL